MSVETDCARPNIAKQNNTTKKAGKRRGRENLGLDIALSTLISISENFADEN
jgi:hypothetical protein